MSSTLITVAPTGAELDKAAFPQLPTTLDELVAEATASRAAGAGLVHVHIRDEHAAPTLDLPRLVDTVAALRDGTDLVVQLSTGGSVHDGLAPRLRVLEAAPDSCSITCGTVNFGDDVFLNPWPFIVDLHQAARDAQVVPEYEIFDLGQVTTLTRLLDEHGLPFGGRVHVDMVMGVPGGMPGTAAILVAAVAALPESVTSWSATGIGRAHLPVLAAALSMGGHVRVGMEDTITFARGRRVTSNAELVARAAQASTLLERPVMTPDEARMMLGVPPRAA